MKFQTKHLSLSYLAIILSSLLSCDCVQTAKGSINDEITKLPIDSALVFNSNEESNKDFKGSKGMFKIHSISGSCHGCPPMKITIEKRVMNLKL